MADYKYKKKYIKEVDKYLRSTVDKPSGMKVKVKLPSIENFAVHLHVARKSIYNWKEKHPEFAVALDKILDEQKSRLINEGLSGNYNPTIAKLLLSANHGMREKSDVTTDDQPINTFSDEQVDRIAERIRARRGNNGNPSSSE